MLEVVLRRPSERDRASIAAIASAAAAAATGLELCARRTRDRALAVAASSAATVVRKLVDDLVASAPMARIKASPRTRTGDRLRWEWLASTGAVLDGEADSRLLAECTRLLTETLSPRPVVGLGEDLDARLRLASAEVWSLAHTVRREHAGALADDARAYV